MKKGEKKPKMVYNIKYRALYDKNHKGRRRVFLTPKEGMLLMMFSNDGIITYEDIKRVIYKDESEVTDKEKMKLRGLVCKLRKKLYTYRKELVIYKNNKRTDARLGRYIMKGAVWLE